MTTHLRRDPRLPRWDLTRSIRVWALIILAVAFLASHSTSAQTESGSSGSGSVYVVLITGTIDLGLTPYLSRVLDQAEAEGAAAELLQIDTPGGRLDAVLQMRDALLGSGVLTIAFVDRTAFSAGALIAIACEEIYMTPGAVMGAAQGRAVEPPHRRYRPNELRLEAVRAERLRREARRTEPAVGPPGRSLEELRERRPQEPLPAPSVTCSLGSSITG